MGQDLLTSYNGQALEYDAIGNPETYRDGITMTWQNGRQLASFTQTNGASVNGSEVIISKEGTYILTGKASDGAVIVDAGDNDKIQIVLNGLDLTSSKSPFIIKNADKVFLTLAKKSENTLSDASSYELTVDD